MTPPPFVHLHVHTHYSLLDGATRIVPLIERAKQWQMPAVAITDHGNMFGAIEFYLAAKKAGIKPIIGCEAYLASGHRSGRSSSEDKDSFHILLLAMNREGYQNLIRLSSIGYLEGFYRRPRIDKEILREHSAGLICTSTCIGGEVPQAFLTKDRAAAEEMAKTYLSIFGPDRFFIELQDHGIAEQRTLNPELADLAKRVGVATIVTNDVHYLDRDDVEAHDVLCCINTGKTLMEEDRFKFPSGEFYFKNAEEISVLFPGHLDAMANTLHVAGMCNLELDLSKRYAPVYRVPAEIADAPGESSQSNGLASKQSASPSNDGEHQSKMPQDGAYLRRLVFEGAKERYGELSEQLRERIEYELGVIIGKGFASYFLIVWDCVHFARQRGIPVSARGSGCSSVVSYCLRISTPDPIRYELYFERFLDPDRDEMPDIDLDICQNGRAEVLEYVRGKYGHVAQIITFGTLKAKAVVKDVSRVLGLGFAEANELTKLIPSELFITLDKALAQEPELLKRYKSDPRVKRILDIGRRLEGVARNAGVHAAGVVVADQPLVNFLPLYKSTGQEGLVTQFDGPTVEKVGLLKMDFLGLRTLTTLERARQLARQSAGADIDLEKIDLTDQRVYSLFTRGETAGIFQFESGGMRDVVMRMKPNRIEDLIAANALFRPGPMEYIPDYIARKHGQNWSTPHPIMTEVLRETYGIMVYQEQVSRIVNRLGGLELKTAFRLAKAISKKKTDMIEVMREPFLQGCAGNGVRRDVGEQVFADILKFGGYAFNKAHSTGYALVAYQTAWMKTYFPLEFMAAVMTFEMVSTEKVAEYREECKKMGVAVQPPNVNTSHFDFSIERTPEEVELERGGSTSNKDESRTAPLRLGSIRFGLGAIKGVGEKAVASIIEQRTQHGSFKNIFDFCERVDLSIVNKGTIEALVCAGAFDSTGAMRRALFEALERAMAVGQSTNRDRRAGQMGLFGAASPDSAAEPAKPFLTNAEWSESEMLKREKSVLGFYITRHPLTEYAQLLGACGSANTAELEKYKDGEKVTIGGIITSLRTVVTKTGANTGKQVGILSLEDLSGKVDCVLFADQLAKYRPIINQDAVVFIEGEVDRRRETPSIRASNVIPAEIATEYFARGLLVDVHEQTPLDEMLSLFKANRGECRVYLNVPTSDGLLVQIECHSFKVECKPHFISALKGLTSQQSVRIVGPQRRALNLFNGNSPGPESSARETAVHPARTP